MDRRNFLVALVIFGIQGALSQNCSCPSGILRGLQICGTDGVTYPTACALNNAQRTNRTLGLKCLGPCPCPAPSPGVASFCSMYGLWPSRPGVPVNPPPFPPPLPATAAPVKPPPAALPTTPPAVPDFIGRPVAGLPVSGRRHIAGRQRHFGGGYGYSHHGGWSGGMDSWSGGRPGHIQHGYFGWSIPRPQICLTDGTTMDCPLRTRCAIANPSSPGLGIRCWDNCSRCAAAPTCPGVVGPSPPVGGGGTPAVPGSGTTDLPGPPPPVPDFVSLTNEVYHNRAFGQE